MIRLGRQKVLVQELAAIEGLARVDVVCADKTGTLTENGMRCRSVVPLAELGEGRLREALANLAAGDPHPNASLTAIGEEVGAPPVPWTPTDRAPFTSAKKWSGVSFAGEGAWVLGPPTCSRAARSPPGPRRWPRAACASCCSAGPRPCRAPARRDASTPSGSWCWSSASGRTPARRWSTSATRTSPSR
ncbi:hypothetical protein [Propioniciclava coleopterorum]|uniref:hypothetical protein n=1 Tax=Propioniciclava coleopterorum TaxID=2714937 RepID=UPI001FE72BF7|nr:hypothetical protein [Propioniciclava coleopterorum]